MIPLDDQVADYFTWLDAELSHAGRGEVPEPVRGQRWWLLTAAAAAVAALVTGLIVIADRDTAEAPAVAPPPGAGTVSPATEPSASTPSTAPWTGPPSRPLASTASCAGEYSLDELANRGFAFDGTVTEVSDGYLEVTFAVNEWFRGDPAPATIALLMGSPNNAYGPEADWSVGSRLLVSGEPSTGAWMCGFSRTYDPATAADWRATFAGAWADGWLTVDLPDAVRVDRQTHVGRVVDPPRFTAWGDLAHEPVRAMSLAYVGAPSTATPGAPGAEPEGPVIDGAPDGEAWVNDVGFATWVTWQRGDGTMVTARGTGVSLEQLADWMFAIVTSADTSAHPDPTMLSLPVRLDGRAHYLEHWELDAGVLDATATTMGAGVLLTQGFTSIEPREIDGRAGFVGYLRDETWLMWPLDAAYWANVQVPGLLDDRLDEIIAALHAEYRDPADPADAAPTFTPPLVTAPDTTPSPDGGPLQRVLDGEGVDIAAAPEAVRDAILRVAMGTDLYCGVDRSPQGAPHVTDEQARRCFLDHSLLGAPAVFVETQSTSEGDPIITLWRSHADGTVAQYVHSNQDSYGSGGWQTSECASVTTHFPDAPAALSPTLFRCSDQGAPSRGAAATFPDWWGLIPPTSTCGYFGPAEEPDRSLIGAGWECFMAARDRGEAVELVHWTESEAGRSVRWWRSAGSDGGAEHVQLVTWTDAPGTAGSGWRLLADCTLAYSPGERPEIADWGIQSSCGDDPTGTISGSLTVAGAPARGTISLRQHRPPNGVGTSWLANADLLTTAEGTFEFVVPVGQYDVWGQSPSFGAGDCPAEGTTITVLADETSRLDLTCDRG